MKLSENERAFLQRIDDLGGSAKSGKLSLADRIEDRARQRCRRAGLVAWASPSWHILPAGRAALKDAPPHD